jgi:hypothetical protein
MVERHGFVLRTGPGFMAAASSLQSCSHVAAARTVMAVTIRLVRRAATAVAPDCAGRGEPRGDRSAPGGVPSPEIESNCDRSRLNLRMIFSEMSAVRSTR